MDPVQLHRRSMHKVRAAVIRDKALRVEEVPDPVPGEGEILIRVRAAGINGADIGQVAGNYPAPPGWPQDIPGLECSGETEDGIRVMALLGGGGQAELVAVPAEHVLPVPEQLTWEQAGGFVETFATAHDALFTQAELKPGERLLVNGAAGGVGTAAVQLGVAIGADVTGTVRHHAAEVEALGASTTVEGKFDVILELVGGANLATNLELLAPKGRIAVIGVGAGATQTVNFHRLMAARGRIHGSTLRSRSREEKADVIRRLRDEVLPLGVTVPVEETFPLDQAQQAYERFVAGQKFGKIVICP
jgi:NADPH:quinone reductase-like Zn-dependent oxidoreductase